MIQKYSLVCGLEIHAELKTKSKMFCGCKNDPFSAPQPNIYTCPVCLGMPGGLPLPNKKAIEWTIKLGLALNCKINLFSKFDRKNYFYPDLAKGYQISQYDIPFCYDGYIKTSQGKIGITRIHLEEDTGKLLHKQKKSLIDFNRSGVPLVEIVTQPDIISSSQAKEYGKKIRQILRHLQIGDCDMEQGGMRLEANISLSETPINLGQPIPQDKLPNYKVEVKNINSFRFLQQAIDFEIKRQAKILDRGETPSQETRGFNPNTGKTFSQRSKEDAEDYRYFPDPDIPPIQLTEEEINEIRLQIPLLPSELQEKWHEFFGIEPKYSQHLIKMVQLIEVLEKAFISLRNQQLNPNHLANLIVNKKIELPDHTQSIDNQIESLVSNFIELNKMDEFDSDQLLTVIQQIIEANPKEVSAYRQGRTQLINFFVGQVMKQLSKKIDVAKVRKILIEKLK